MTNPMSVNALNADVASAVVSHLNPCIFEILQEDDRSDITVSAQPVGGSSATMTHDVSLVADSPVAGIYEPMSSCKWTRSRAYGNLLLTKVFVGKRAVKGKYKVLFRMQGHDNVGGKTFIVEGSYDDFVKEFGDSFDDTLHSILGKTYKEFVHHLMSAPTQGSSTTSSVTKNKPTINIVGWGIFGS